MTRKKKALKILDKLEELYPDVHIHLDYETPIQLLLATILSAQCTDAKVNEVTPRLWEAFPTAEEIAGAPPEKLQEILRPTGFFRQKTKSIQAVCRAIAGKYRGKVPDDMDLLTELPGVGRKTANVVLANAFERQTIPVDTHVKRVSVRLGLADGGDADKIEKQLCGLIPPDRHTQTALLFGEHGRTTCKSRRPDCPGCALKELCDYRLKHAKTPYGAPVT